MTTPNKTQHTPGPWRVGSRGSYHQRHYIEIMADIPLRGRRHGATMEMPVCEVGINEADARLIAAAPELLAALHSTNCDTDAEGYFCNCPLADGTRPDSDHATSCVDARHAIAKAEGRSE